MMKQRWGHYRNLLRPTPGDPWGVEQHHWNTGAKENPQLSILIPTDVVQSVVHGLWTSITCRLPSFFVVTALAKTNYGLICHVMFRQAFECLIGQCWNSISPVFQVFFWGLHWLRESGVQVSGNSRVSNLFSSLSISAKYVIVSFRSVVNA